MDIERKLEYCHIYFRFLTTVFNTLWRLLYKLILFVLTLIITFDDHPFKVHKNFCTILDKCNGCFRQ